MKFLLLLATIVFSNIALASGELDLPACYTQDGQKVAVVEARTRVPSPAYAKMMNGQPVIVFNTNMLGVVSNSRSMLTFIYLHECGHHALGHTTNPPESYREANMRELAADCYAGKMVRELYNKKRESIDIESVAREILNWPRDKEHPSGETRVSVVVECYNKS